MVLRASKRFRSLTSWKERSTSLIFCLRFSAANRCSTSTERSCSSERSSITAVQKCGFVCRVRVITVERCVPSPRDYEATGGWATRFASAPSMKEEYDFLLFIKWGGCLPNYPPGRRPAADDAILLLHSPEAKIPPSPRGSDSVAPATWS